MPKAEGTVPDGGIGGPKIKSGASILGLFGTLTLPYLEHARIALFFSWTLLSAKTAGNKRVGQE